jgi:hypothetical protein
MKQANTTIATYAPEGEAITYKFDKMTFIVTPIYQAARGESVAAILLRLMKADAERV